MTMWERRLKLGRNEKTWMKRGQTAILEQILESHRCPRRQPLVRRFGRTSLKTQPEKQLSRDQSAGRLEEGLMDPKDVGAGER